MSLYPFLRSPFTDLTGFMFNAQQRPDSLCAKIEMRFYDCLEAYGIDKGKEKCMDLAADMRECGLRGKEVSDFFVASAKNQLAIFYSEIPT